MTLARRPRTFLAVGIVGPLALAGCLAAAAPAAEEQQPEPPETTAAVPKLPPGIEIESVGTFTLTPDGAAEFSGPVTISWKGSRIQADRMALRGNHVEAEGNVLIAWGANRIFGSRMTYDLETERGTIFEAMGQVLPDFLFWADRVEKIGPDQVYLEDATVTTCTQPLPYWSFRVTSATIRLDKYARMWNVRLRARKVPLIYLPYLIWPVKPARAAGLLLPEYHSTTNRGSVISQELFVPLGRSADVTFLGRRYSKAGFGGGGEARFIPNREGQARLSGFYIDDKVAGFGRYRAAYEQTQQFRNGFRMVADVNLVSDFDYFTHFERELSLISTPQVRTRVEFARNDSWTSLNVRELRIEHLFADDSRLVQQTLPEIEWRGRSRRLGPTPFYLTFEASMASIQQRSKDFVPAPDRGPIDADYLRGDLFPTITMPISPVRWLDITPRVSYRTTYYSQRRVPGGQEEDILDRSLFRGLGSAGLEIIGPKIFRIFGDEEGARYKHTFEPRLTYGVGESFDHRDEVIVFDEVDRFSAAGNQMTYALSQRLFARRPRAELVDAPASTEIIVLPDGTTDEPPPASAVTRAPDAPPPPTEEPVEVASLELRQSRSFDEDLSQADLSTDGELESFSPYSDVQLTGRYNPNPSVSVDVRSSYDILFDSIRDVSLSGNLRSALSRMRFSLIHSNGLGVDPSTLGPREDSTQVRLTAGMSFFGGKLEVDVDGSFIADAGTSENRFPDKRWRVKYATQCCTFFAERVTRNFAVDEDDRRDLYLRVDLSGVGKLLDHSF